jgi:transposase
LGTPKFFYPEKRRYVYSWAKSKMKNSKAKKISERSKIEIAKILILENFTLQEISEILRESYGAVYSFVKKNFIQLPPGRGRKFPAKRKEISRLLLESDLSTRAIARRVGVSQRTVCYHAKKIRVENHREAGEFQPVELQEVRRCPVHGLVNVWPCVACESSKG